MNTTRYPHRRRGPLARRGGFTLVEILVVLGIIVVLVGILAPAIAKGYRNGLRTKMAADLNAIVAALEAYRQDHGDIPRITTDRSSTDLTAWSLMGDALLCRALVGPMPAVDPGGKASYGDGQDGNGFRVRPPIVDTSTGLPVPQGKPYGPYISPDKIKVVYDLNTKSMYLADHSGGRILYLAGRKGGDINVNGGYIGDVSYTALNTVYPLYNLADLRDGVAADDRIALFDNGAAGKGADKFRVLAGADANGRATDVALTGDFLLWTPGPDEKFGYEGPVDTDPDKVSRQRAASDDVTYPAR